MPTPPRPDAVRDVALPLRIVWSAVLGGAVVAVGAMAWLSALRETAAPLAGRSEGAFYVVALLGVAGTAGAFALVHRMGRRVWEAETDERAERAVRLHTVAALAAAEVPALAAAVALLLTGDPLVLAFAAPLFAFAALLWPSDDRVAGWLGARRA